jgi:hypothetical protein
MKTVKVVFLIVLTALLIAVPAAADAHGFGGGAILGFGLGLFTGFAFAPRAVYVGPPVYYAPPPLVGYPYYPYAVPAPVPPDPEASRYSNSGNLPSAHFAPPGQSRCREWRLIDRRWENKWDPYYGRWRAVLVEKWGWAGVPCNN